MVDKETQKSIEATTLKVAGNVVFGFGVVSQQKKGDGWEDYFDLQGDFIPEDVMLEASKEFMSGDRKALAQHQGEQVGQIIFALPLTHDVAKALDITEYGKTGLILGMRVDDAATLLKFASGEYSGFSLGGKIKREGDA